ncbi:MAG: protease, partial [Gammaproteobacteria bacterium]|nr:protease [Gammaproteobacteria bacterium]
VRSRSVNFFEHQDKARRKTWLLVIYFLLAVFFIVLAVNLATYFAFYMAAGATEAELQNGIGNWIKQPYLYWVTVGTLAVIAIGTLFTFLKLRGGGRVVAEMVGARKVDSATSDLNERRLINIVEEMSIASGTPVPELYVMDDSAINAFVAGYRPTEAVLVVTRGALENFNRDELQGVIGHEYSHIFNGDMRINIRLMGVLAGILLIGQVGRFLLRSSGRSRGGSKKGGGQIVLFGLALFIIGYIGLFFGSLIKAAISRQREFLADASSVQFTRNPDGIAGALWAIKENMSGSLLLNAHAEDISHFCFSDAIGAKFTSLMATHPPLEERIKAVNPHFDLKKRLQRRQTQEPVAAGQSRAGIDAVTTAAGTGFTGSQTATVVSATGIGASIGQTQARHLDYAVKMHAKIPSQLAVAVHQRSTVRQLIYALILADMKLGDRQTALEVIKQAGATDMIAAINTYCTQLQETENQFRLTLINIAIPALKSLDQKERSSFLKILEDLTKADKRYTIFEFALLTILHEHLSEKSGHDVKVKYFKYSDVMPEINLMLSMLARIGAGQEDAARLTYEAIIKHYTPVAAHMADKADCKLSAISAALQKLNQLSPILKQTVIESFADCVIHDGKVLPAEAELLQAIALSLDCPMPPLLA